MQETVLQPCALHHDIVGELEAPLKAAGGNAAMQERRAFDLRLLLAANREGVLLDLDGQVLVAEPGDCHADTVIVLADALDIVGRVAGSVAVKIAERIQQRAKAVEADGRTIKRGEVELSHHILLQKRYVFSKARSEEPGEFTENAQALQPCAACIWEME